MNIGDMTPDSEHYLFPTSPIIRGWLTPDRGRRVQSFEYYAAQFIIGSGLICKDPEAVIRAWAHELKLQYEAGVEHGLRHPGVAINPTDDTKGESA